jgi:hypothetical protein
LITPLISLYYHRWHDPLEPDANSATNDGDTDTDIQDVEESSSQVALEETEAIGDTENTFPTSIYTNQPSEQQLKALLNASSSSMGTMSSSALMTEAFNKVKEASYALGYWTAIYQMQAAAGANVCMSSLFMARC